MIRAGIFILAMAMVGVLINWRDWKSGNIETPFGEGDFAQMQIILGIFGAIGLVLMLIGWRRRSRA
ncbi:MAG: hypothetical protein AAFO77_01910 [Pseudomonadota bacterium]